MGWQHWTIIDKDTQCTIGVYHGEQSEAIKEYPNHKIMIDNRNDLHPFWKRYHARIRV